MCLTLIILIITPISSNLSPKKTLDIETRDRLFSFHPSLMEGPSLCAQQAAVSQPFRFFFGSSTGHLGTHLGHLCASQGRFGRIEGRTWAPDLWETCRSSRAFCELSGRTKATVGDVFMALMEMGADIESIIPYAKRHNRITLSNPASLPRSSISRILQAGEKRSLPSYIPDNFPPFPDPHTYIRTPTHRQPISDYEIIREKAATQKRDTERALTKFIAKTGPTNSLFPDDVSLFPLIACKPTPNPFYSGLLFTDQVFDKEETEVPNVQASNQYSAEDSEAPKDANTDGDIMDNPYLRPAKLQRKRRK